MLRSQSVSSYVEQDIRYRIHGGRAMRINELALKDPFLSSQFEWLDKWILYLPLFVRIKPSHIKRSKCCTIFITIAILLGLILTIQLQIAGIYEELRRIRLGGIDMIAHIREIPSYCAFIWSRIG